MTQTHIITAVAVAAALAVSALFFIFNPFMSFGTELPGAAALAGGESASLVVQDEVIGSGDPAELGDVLSVSYTGKLDNGTVFDTSVGKAPYTFTLGVGEVIPGWDQGLVGMKAGGKRMLIIPPSLAYGSNSVGSIPPNATLQFEVELISVTRGSGNSALPSGVFMQ